MTSPLSSLDPEVVVVGVGMYRGKIRSRVPHVAVNVSCDYRVLVIERDMM